MMCILYIMRWDEISECRPPNPAPPPPPFTANQRTNHSDQSTLDNTYNGLIQSKEATFEP